MKRFMHSAVLHGIIGAAMVCAAAACTQRSDRELVLDDFSEAVRIAPSDSVDLEQFGIYGAYKAIPYDGWYAVHKFGGSNALDIISIQNKEKIECLRIGRGPGEVSHIGGIQEYAGDIYAFDVNLKTLYSIDIAESIAAGEQKFAESLNLRKNDKPHDFLNEPYSLFKFKDGLIATGIFQNGIWFGSIDENGNIISGIPLVDFESTKELSATERSAFQLSSYISVCPDGSRGVCAMLYCGAFSIFDISGNILHEKMRKIYYEPKVISMSGEMISPAHDGEETKGFFSAESTEDLIYLLYSGRTWNEYSDAYSECSHLLVYDWDGNPVRRYELEKTINSIYLHEGRIYGTSMHPEARIYVYNLP